MKHKKVKAPTELTCRSLTEIEPQTAITSNQIKLRRKDSDRKEYKESNLGPPLLTLKAFLAKSF